MNKCFSDFYTNFDLFLCVACFFPPAIQFCFSLFICNIYRLLLEIFLINPFFKLICEIENISVSRICPEDSDFIKHKREKTHCFLKNGYPESLIKTETEKNKFRQRLVSRREGITKVLPLVLTYHPLLKSVPISHKHLPLLYMDKEAKKGFTLAPIVSFKSSRKLSSYLAKAKLYPWSRTVASFKCNKSRCEVYVKVLGFNLLPLG